MIIDRICGWIVLIIFMAGSIAFLYGVAVYNPNYQLENTIEVEKS